MRNLVIMSGPPGVGKSSLIDELQWKQYTLSADSIRLQLSSPEMNPDGTPFITQKVNQLVWDILFQMLEKRMERGEFTVIDGKHDKLSDFTNYKKLAERYRYRMYVIPMHNVGLNTILERNSKRELYKRVPEDVIKKSYTNCKSLQFPKSIVKLPTDAKEIIAQLQYKPHDMNKYENIFIFGDIHGCYNPLKKFFEDNPFSEKNYYLFTGDYLDRGIQNVETFEFLYSLMNNYNVGLIEGNHEITLKAWIYEDKVFGNLGDTLKQIYNIPKSRFREFIRKLIQMSYFTYDGKKYFVNHGGIPYFPQNLMYVPTHQLLYGSGKYQDMELVAETWKRSNVTDPIIQVHGHRNVHSVDAKVNEYYYVLENQIEYGGNLRVLQLTKDSEPIVHNIPNELYSINSQSLKRRENIDDFISYCMNNVKDIIVKEFDDDLVSITYNKKTFMDSKWNNITMKTRGLWIDKTEKRVVARSYDKFFNLDENKFTKITVVKEKIEYPLKIYKKEDGFLCLVFIHKDKLYVTTKASLNDEFIEYAIESIGGALLNVKHYLEENPNKTFLFEVVNKRDPHILKIPENKAILLDVFDNELFTNIRMPYDELKNLAKELGLIVKEYVTKFNNFTDFTMWWNDQYVTGENFEGYVAEDSLNFMFKLKISWYLNWKYKRDILDRFLSEKELKITDGMKPDVIAFIKYLEANKEEIFEKQYSIDEIRDKFISD